MWGVVVFVWSLHPRLAVLSLVNWLVSAGLVIAVPVLVGQVVGRVEAAVVSGPSATFVILVALLVIALTADDVLGNLLQPGYTTQINLAWQAVVVGLARALARPREIGHLEGPEVADEVERARGRLHWILGGVGALEMLVFGGVSIGGAAIALAIVLNWWIPLVLVASLVFNAWRMQRLSRDETDIWEGNTEPQRHARYAFEQATGAATKEVRVFGLADFLARRFREQTDRTMVPYWRSRRRTTWRFLSLEVGTGLLATGAAAYTAYLGVDGRLTVTEVTTSLGLILALASSRLYQVVNVQKAGTALAAYHRLMRRLAEVEPVGRAHVADRVRDRAPAPTPTVVLEDVSFSYPGSSRLVLEHLDLELPAGRATALVGINGAGKSTLVKLLAGVYRPTTGAVLVDGVALDDLGPDELARWQRRVAPITQDFVRLPLSAGDNVEIGAGRLWQTRLASGERVAGDGDELERAAARAGVAELVRGLPAGWATPLDPTFDGGTDLSGGQWQRIALARALRAVSGGAGLLVLDEPAAALDVRAEADLVDGYLRVTRDVTSLVISHRFSVVRPVPTVAVLDHGRIVERGSHDELMDVGGRYARMFTAQAERYAATGAVDA